MIMRALRLCAGRLTAPGAILGCVALALASVPLAASPALAGVTEGTDIDRPVIVVQPSITQAGTVMRPTVTVDVVEPRSGRLDPDFSGLVTLAYAANPDGAPGPTGNVARAAHGVATFPRLTFSAVGFGFTLAASIPRGTSAPSSAFDIVTQLITCQPGQSCQSGTVSADGTSGASVGLPGPSAGFLAATAGGFPDLSCTTLGGVLTFSASRPQKITIENSSGQAERPGSPHSLLPGVCWGAPSPFVTRNGTTSVFNPVNGDYEGLLPYCVVLLERNPPPCVLSEGPGLDGGVIARVLAPAGDPHITF